MRLFYILNDYSQILIIMSSYELGAYEALQWAWSVLRDTEEKSSSVKEVKKEIFEKLKILGNGKKINLREQALIKK
jgi:hypothetical protein